MRIAFIDPSGWDFNVETPFHHALGGTHSAACYLAIAMAADKGGAGHHVSFISNTSSPGTVRGVNCLSTRNFAPNQLPTLNLDAAILLMGAGAALKMRDSLGSGPKLVLWTGHAANQQGVASLSDSSRREALDGFAMVSDWQRRQFVEKFNLPPDRTAIMRYGVAPAFLESAIAPPQDRPRPPILAYTSTPFRGLDVLMNCFPEIRRRCPGVRLKIFSDMGIYLTPKSEDEKEYGELYRRCRETEGVEYVGALPQPELAKALREVSILAYSNTFAETSCISVLEAMASGCRIVTSDLGALSETTAGFARLIQPGDGYNQRFIEETVRAIEEMDSPATNALLDRQVAHIRENRAWPQRVGEWEKWLGDLPRAAHRSKSTEDHFPIASLPRNREPMDPYFGEFLGLLRRALMNGGSEFGLGLTLFSLAASIRAATIIEIGRFKGFSTLALASALRLADVGWDEPDMHKERPEVNYAAFEAAKKRQLFSIDPFPTPEARALLDEAKLLPYVTMIDRLSAGVNFEGPVDLIFIDGEHTYDAALADVRRFVPKNLRAGGYFILHDYYGWYDAEKKSRSPVRAVIEQLIGENELEHLLIDTGYQSFVIFRKPDPKAAGSLGKV